MKKLKRYEASLELYKDDEHDPDRVELVQKITAIKAQLSAQRSPGAQLDAARSALQRATNRREEADKAVAAAELLRDKATTEEDAARAEVANLEAMVVAPEAETDALKSVQHQLGRLLQTLKSDQHVARDHANAWCAF